MKGIPAELLYVLAFVGFLIFNYVMQKAARRRQEEEEAQAPAQPAPAPVEEELGEDIWGRTPVPPPPVAARAPAPIVARAPAPLPTVTAPPRPAHPIRALLKDKRDLRRAVALTMVLGPCRAQEPPPER